MQYKRLNVVVRESTRDFSLDTYTINLYKYVQWKERDISEESYRPVAAAPASCLKFMFGRIGVFLQIASHILYSNENVFSA